MAMKIQKNNSKHAPRTRELLEVRRTELNKKENYEFGKKKEQNVFSLMDLRQDATQEQMTQQFQQYYFQCDLPRFYIKTCVEIKNEK